MNDRRGNDAGSATSYRVEKELPITRLDEDTNGRPRTALKALQKLPSYVQPRRDGSTASSRAPPSRMMSAFSFGKRGLPALLSIPEADAPPAEHTRPKLSKSSSQYIESHKNLQLSILPISGYAPSSSRRLLDATRAADEHAPTGSTTTLIRAVDSMAETSPKRFMEVDIDKSTWISDLNFVTCSRYELTKHALGAPSPTVMPNARESDIFFAERESSLKDRIVDGDIRDFDVNSEVSMLGVAWRGALRRIVVWAFDRVNALLLTRALQLFLPFLTGYEAYVMDQLIEALDKGHMSDIAYVLAVAFQNRNVSRILVQQLGPRFDFFWHWSTMVAWNRLFDAFGQIPIVGITSFPATENFPSTRDHALASIFRTVLGEGNWLARVVTQGREGLVTDNPNNVAQNLAAESNGFELANRNQYGTYFGRIKTNEFRLAHRLPVDESIVRTFVAQPMATLLNNGVVHVLRQLAKHWHNTLRQENFAHQRMEQLDPFETLRFHMPIILLALASLRGRNRWDSKCLGPILRELQNLKPAFSADMARHLIRKLRTTVAVNVSGGVASILDPLLTWLDAIEMACDGVEEEAKKVYEIVASVEVGIRLGHDLIAQIDWRVPSDDDLKQAIILFIRGCDLNCVEEDHIQIALTKMTPRDMRTLFELVKTGLGNRRPAQLLLGRAKTLLQRELRRKVLNEGIRRLSIGAKLSSADLEHDEWYWLEEKGHLDVYICDSKVTGRDQHRFVDVVTKVERYDTFSDGRVTLRAYIPVAEAITRAQSAFMNIELDHGKRYSYSAFMEFSFLRTALRRLVVISELTCEALDKARLDVLSEIQRSKQQEVSVPELEVGRRYFSFDPVEKRFVPFVCEKKYTKSDPEWESLGRLPIVTVPPQSTIVVGGGPTGLVSGIHCLENVLASGGDMMLYEARDSFARGGSTFERAQIVRLDARWIAMLRYHLGTSFEDVFVPASGETDSQLGNTLSSQGFVEITIKNLENMLHSEVSRLWSRGLLTVHTDSQVKFDPKRNALTKLGEHLKLHDGVLRQIDETGRRSADYHRWKVVELVYAAPLNVTELHVGQEYGIYLRVEASVVPFKLVSVDLESGAYTFKALDEFREDLKATAAELPSVYARVSSGHVEVDKVVMTCMKAGPKQTHVSTSLPMKIIRKQKFMMDVGHSHVVEAIGKPHGSEVHFNMTTYEPYGVCCIQGLKVSMGMHNFGEKRWGAGLVDDIRSQSDQNTRIVGDFTKMVRSAPVAKKMMEYMTDMQDENWQSHFRKIVENSSFPELNDFDPIVPKMQLACREFAKAAPAFERQTLQTRFFETGDNFYLGMELTREYDVWKNSLAIELVGPLKLKAKTEGAKANVNKLKSDLTHHIDRLWYEAVLEIIRTGDVYNPGARRRVPRLYTINSYTDKRLDSLPIGETFRLTGSPKEVYETLMTTGTQVVVRNVEGYISKLDRSTLVRREGNLTRSPDGNSESKVALATFPVAHYVNHRTMRLNDVEKGYVFAFVGDEQATPHFMRYSGLTGGCVNAMSFNNFLRQAMEGVPFVDRFRQYSMETNWSNGEVVQRGTGGNYGEDGFLRPGFSYECLIDYLHSKVIEYQESEQDLNTILSHDWQVKVAASLVPRGMELNASFTSALSQQLQRVIFDKLMKEITADNRINSDSIGAVLKARSRAMAAERLSLDCESYWHEFMAGLRLDGGTKQVLEDGEVSIAIRLEQTCSQVVDFARKAHLYNERVSSEMYNQPKPVDSIVDDFAVEAQNFANSLVMSAAFASGVLAFRLVGDRMADIASTVLAVLNIAISFGTMTNSARYKIRNEEARVQFADEKLSGVLKGVFSVLDCSSRQSIPVSENPFVVTLETEVASFLKSVEYYGGPDPGEFVEAYALLKSSINDSAAIRAFQRLLTTKFIVDTYHVNSYLQESLVRIDRLLNEILILLAHEIDCVAGADDARNLFARLMVFQPRLEGTLQRGAVRYGFVKIRKLSQWDAFAVVKYACSLLVCSRAATTLVCAPISTETLDIVKQTKKLARRENSHILAREIRDLDTLYWATRESEIGSFTFMSAFLVFLASIIFSAARAFRVGVLEDFAFWAVAASALGAILATFHLWRKLWILLRLTGILVAKSHTSPSRATCENVRRVLGVTITQVLLTLMRLGTVGAASVALPWSVVENGYGVHIGTYERLPFWIASVAVGMAMASTLFFFVVEYIIRYNLSPKLGEFVCESFRDEIEELCTTFRSPLNDIDSKHVQERDTWEYVAREFLHRYRFDAVFAADRFGSILQYIQSGMHPRT